MLHSNEVVVCGGSVHGRSGLVGAVVGMLKTADLSSVLVQSYAPIADDLRVVEQIFDEELACDLPFVTDLCDTVRSYRGKMLRPALLLLCGRAAGELRSDHHTLAAVIEMVHMATLVHDDVLDEADERRRQPTIGTIAGNEAAVLLGDFLISHAYHLCSSLNSQYASRRVADATNTVCEGELLQNHYSGILAPNEARYFDIVRRKTGALTAAACELGGVFAGASQDVVAGLRQYGLQAGVAFQIVDDVLDLVGDEGEVGKTLGRDWASGKLTLPLIHCLQSAPASVQGALRTVLADPSRFDREEVCTALDQTGSIEHAVSVAREYTADALVGLEMLPPGDARSSLEAMAEFIVGRRF